MDLRLNLSRRRRLHVILGQVWYLIVSIPDLCTLTYFDLKVVGCWVEVTAFVDVVTHAFYLLIHFYFLVLIVCL